MTGYLIAGGHIPQANAFWGKSESEMKKARRYYQSHEYYKARSAVQEILNKNPGDDEAQKFMADILDKEIERQKKQVLPQAIEEMNHGEKFDEVKSWLERSRTLFAANQYDLALFAAEKVFLYDPSNNESSELIDKIKAKALKEGKADTLFIHKMYKEEIAERLSRYRNDAEDLFVRGQLGQARFTAEKVLLLEPEDPQALALYQKIMAQEEKMRGASL